MLRGAGNLPEGIPPVASEMRILAQDPGKKRE